MTQAFFDLQCADVWNQVSQSKILLRPTSGWVPIDFQSLWNYRELAWTLAMREVLVRYKQSILGAGWAVLQPVVTMIVFTVLFSALLGHNNLPTVQGIPYAVSTYCALLPWQLFSQAAGRASGSIVGNANLISKIYFPRLIIPIAPVLASLVDFVVALAVLVALMAWYRIVPGLGVLLLPAFVLFAMVFALAVGMWLASLTAMYRDFQYIIGFFIQIWMYVSPILYTAESVLKGRPAWVQFVYGLNPMAGIVEGFRWALLGTRAPDPIVMASSILATLLLLLSGLFFFKRMERLFADVV
jgi:lipopolysaccharide transport system permease protein